MNVFLFVRVALHFLLVSNLDIFVSLTLMTDKNFFSFFFHWIFLKWNQQYYPRASNWQGKRSSSFITQSLRFIGHKSMNGTETSRGNNLSAGTSGVVQQEYPVATTVTSSGVQQQAMVTTTPLLQQGQQAMSSVTSNSTFADNGTTGPIAVNPVLGTDLLSPTRDNVSPTMRMLADSSSAALVNVINNSSAMLNQNLVNSSKVSMQNNVPGNMSSSEYESKLLVNSLYRKGSSRRRRLIQNPWDQVESTHHLMSLESMNPRYASRPELFPGLYFSRHLRGSSSNNVNNSDHVYECIDADSVNNYNILSDELKQQLSSSSHQYHNRRSNN